MDLRIFSIFSGIWSFLLGGLILYRNSKKASNISFALFALFASLWSVSLYFYVKPVFWSSLEWIKAVYLFVFGMVGSSFYFSFVFPSGSTKKGIIPIIIYSLISIPFIYFLIFSNLWVINVYEDFRGIHTITGPAYPIWGIFNLIIGIWLIVNLYSKYRRSKGIYRHQLLYVFFGIGIMAIGTLIVSVLLPAVYDNSTYFWTSSLFLIPFIASVAYAIVKHRLMDIRLIIARAFSYTILTLIIAGFYASGVFLIGRWLFPITFQGEQLVISVIFAIIVAYTFQPLRACLEKITEDIFFQETYNPEILLGEISKIFKSTLDLNSLAKKSLKKLTAEMRLDFGLIMLSIEDENGEAIVGSKKKIEKISLSKKEVSYIHKKVNNYVIFDEIEEGKFKDLLRNNNIGCIIELKSEQQNIGLLVLGNKLSGNIYSHRDVQILAIIGPQLAVAIQNARRYRQAQLFSKRLEKEVTSATKGLRKANTKLKDIDKQKNEFIAMVAHEIRAPMTAIKGFISMVTEGDTGDISEKTRGYLVDANAMSERVIRLVNNMLNVSRIEEGRMLYQIEDINLSRLAQMTQSQFKVEAERKGLKFKLSIPQEINDVVEADSERLLEVIVNLVSNAVKYTGEGFVEMLLSQPSEDKVKLEVKDSGPGISQAEQKKLFRKFYRVQSNVGKTIGTGLGLHISKLLVEKFKGEIGVDSELKRGSNFWFTLPLKK